MNYKYSAGRMIFGASLATALATAGVNAQEVEDWPCEQAYVPIITAAVVWDGPSPAELHQDWRALPEVEALVRKLSSRNLDMTTADGMIEAFAEQQVAGQKDRMLTLLFAGVLETLNADRKTLMSGIQRYARGQQRRADILGEKLSKMVELERESSESAKKELAEMQNSIEIEQRSFDDRERTLPHLCSRPRALQGRIGAIARTIAGYLD